MCCVRNCETCKGCLEEIGVRALRLIESVFAMLDEHVQVVIWDCGVLLQIVQRTEFLDSKTADISVVD